MDPWRYLDVDKAGRGVQSDEGLSLRPSLEPSSPRFYLEPVLPDRRTEAVAYRRIERSHHKATAILPNHFSQTPTTQTKEPLDCAKWVEELESGRLPRVKIAGLSSCAFIPEQHPEPKSSVSNSPSSSKSNQEEESNDHQSIKDEESAESTNDVQVLLTGTKDLIDDAVVREAKAFNSFDQRSLKTLDADPNGPAPESWIIHGGLPKLDSTYAELKDTLAMEFPFELDTFQKEAICNLELGRSVFVAAHTSAGKTVVAEYAFALALKHCSRAVYTSPIKTISNQKFRDFGSKFEVGIMTGDTQINPHASCLILTTEILRSMLYKGADLTRDMEFVIFDEVHYVNDAERGVVWEETIIMLPPHVQVILLSATVPNVDEFAAWVGRTRETKIYISGTNKRPVPLQHNLYFKGKLFSICDGMTFLAEGYKAAQTEQKTTAVAKGTPGGRGDKQRGGGRGGGGRRGRGRQTSDKNQSSMMHFVNRQLGPNSVTTSKSQQTQLRSLLTALQKQELLPAVVFAFSKKVCDEGAFLLGSVDMNTSAEAHEIHAFIDKSLGRLAEADRSVPQILQMKEYLKRGIGVHHAGLLPIMKEVVEMLFCRGLLKVLFATETFAMGVNAPARTVIFHSLRKHDGHEYRALLPGEYTQMAGRAGRRGIDDVGVVVIACWDEIPEETLLRTLMKGRGVVLSSRFRLTYSMIMNLLRVDDIRVEDMLKRSFAEFHSQKAIQIHLWNIEKADRMLSVLKAKKWPQCQHDCSKPAVRHYYDVTHRLKHLNSEWSPHFLSNNKVQKGIAHGRVVLLFDKESGLVEIGAIVSVESESQQKGHSKKSTTPTTIVVLYLHTPGPWDVPLLAAKTKTPTPKEETKLGMKLLKKLDSEDDLAAKQKINLPVMRRADGTSYKIAEIDSGQLIQMLSDRLHLNMTPILYQDEAATTTIQVLDQLKQIQSKDLSYLDAKATSSVEVSELAAEHQTVLESLLQNLTHRCGCLGVKYAHVHSEKYLETRLAVLRHRISDAALQQMPEFGQRLNVLKHFAFVDETGTVQLKGRVACEINSGDELAITEMIFHGVLTNLEPEEAVAVLSAFVFQEKNQEMPELSSTLLSACEQLRELCLECGIHQFEYGLGLDPESYCLATLNFGLVRVVYEWAKGTSFVEICKLTDVPEGTIVRTIVRLEQSCREVMDAARVMGNTSLFLQMQQASTLIRRDVIFAASLYVSL